MFKAIAARAYKTTFACVLGGMFVWMPAVVHAKGPLLPDQPATLRVAQLPPQGRVTYALIRQGGPFPYDKDGTVFGNRERLLPPYKRGYYREYTVATSGIRHRGARRIVCGGKPVTPDVCYYTADHYNSFRQLIE